MRNPKQHSTLAFPRVLTIRITVLLACLLALPSFTWAAKPDGLDNLIKTRLDIVGATLAYQPAVALDDLAALSPLCAEQLRHQRISELNPKYGSWLSSIRETSLLTQPEFAILRDAKSFHHYCWGEVAQNRYYREASTQKKLDLAQYAASSYKYVIDHPDHLPPGWPYMAKIQTDYGNALLLSKNTPAAAVAFQTALNLDPRTLRAYTGLADLHISNGAKSKALEIVTEGLRYFPGSKPLLRRYNELGGKTPYPEPYPQPIAKDAVSDKPSEENSAPKETPAEAQKSDAVTSTPGSAVSPSEKDTTTTDTPAVRKDNPYCRFCAE